MIRIPYAAALALRSLRRERWINLVSALTIAAALLVISIALLALYNMDAATRNLPEQFSMVVYLDDDITREHVDAVMASLRRNNAVKSIRHIPRDEALRELKSILKNSAYVFEGLDANPLPETLEIKLRKETVGTDTARKVADEASRIKGIREVDYGEKFLQTLQSIKTGVKTVGGTLIVILATGIIFVCYSTVKILFYRRNDEIETFKLLGATRAFIRAPFLIEGGAIGLGGGGLALLGILAFHYTLVTKLSVAIPILKALLFPTSVFLLLPAAGLFLGVTGAAIALGRLRY